MQPKRLLPDDDDVGEVLDLVQRNFAAMEGRINPPSSAIRLSVEDIVEYAREGEIWVIGKPMHSCVFFRPMPHGLYLGRLAVDREQRGKGIATRLIELGEARAMAHNLPMLELHCRVELTENRQFFEKLGFKKVGEGRHEGFEQPTFIVMQLHLAY